MASLKLQNVYKVYDGGVRAVSDFNLDIKDKEFVVFVGPSGCGKSTTLRMIAGLEEITSGDLLMDGIKLNDVQPKDRNVAMVFQNYALYPHMSVFQNMAFGLKLRKLPKEEIQARVKKAAAILGIEDLLDRKPKALSGGQRQRVALGRAIVREPSVFLLDEPLSNLDAKLRVQMRTEITKLHKKLATTFIYVTHDQTEAMTMGDRIVVMKDGFIQQADTPATLYEQPSNVFVATFLGSPQMNIIPAKLYEEEGLKVAFGNGFNAQFSPLKAKQLSDSKYVGKQILLGIRPENITLSESGIPAVVDAVEHLGSETIVFAVVDGLEKPIIVKMPVDHSIVIGLNVNLSFNTEKAQLFDEDSSLAIMGVPTVNTLPCTLTESAIRFANNEMELPEYFTKRLFTHAYSSCKAMNILTEKVTLSPTDECMKIDGAVDFVIENSDNDSVYCRTAIKEGYFVIHTARNAVKSGEKIELYLPYDAIAFVDEKGVRMNSVFEVSENIGVCKVTVDGDITRIKIGNKTLTYSGLNVQSGNYRIRLIADKLSFAYSKKYARKNKIEAGSSECSLPAMSYDEDKLGGGKNAVFVCVPGFENYLSVILDDKFSVYKMPDFPLVIPKDGFELLPIE